MKKLLLFVLLTSFSFGYAQNLSLSQLISLRTMDIEDVEIFLTKKGWSYKGIDTENIQDYTGVQFVYGSPSDFAFGKSFISWNYSENGSIYVSTQISEQEKYFEYLDIIRKYKPGLISTSNEDGSLMKIYQGASNTFVFLTGSAKNKFGDEFPSWTLHIYSNKDINGED